MNKNSIEEVTNPTTRQIKENFNDFTKEPLPLSGAELNNENLPLYQRVKYILTRFLWQDLSRMKRTAPETCYTDDEPVEVFLNFIREYIARAIVKLDEEGVAIQIIEEFNKNRDPNISDDDYVSRAVKMLMDVTDMQDVIKITKDIPDSLDFNETKVINYPKLDFNKKWYGKLIVLPSDDEHMEQAEDYNADMISLPEEEAMDAACIGDFISQLSLQDKQLFMMRLQGKSYEDIAKELGYKDHTGVIKRMRKLGQDFEKQTGIDCGFTVKNAKSCYNKSCN